MSNQPKEIEAVKMPFIGESVYIPFVTDGEGNRVKSAALVPFDTVDAVYSEVEQSQHGKRVYGVRVKSGDSVKVIRKDKYLQAVA